jgi:aspartyl protease family protein
MGLLLLLGVIAAAVIALLMPGDRFIAGIQAGDAIAQMAYGLIAVALAGSVIHRYRGRLGAGLRDALLWIAIFLAVLGGYAYRDELEPIKERILAELIPGHVISTEPGVAQVARRRDGHFGLDVLTNGRTLGYMFDTGASTVVLRAEDAQRLGFDPEKLRFDLLVSTANGPTHAAAATLDAMTIGSITVRQVRAMIAKPGALQENLLGQSFLEKLASYSVEGNRLVMRGR